MKKLILVTVLAMAVSVATADTLHVRLSPGAGEYSKVWDAWDDCNDGDTILVHAGRYTSRRKKNFIVHTNWTNTSPYHTGVTIKGAGDGRAILVGQMKLSATPTGNTSITFEDLYIDTSEPGTSYNRSAFYLDADKGDLGEITVRNCVVYNTGSYNDNGIIYLAGDQIMYQPTFENCTQVNLGNAYQTGKGIYDNYSGLYNSATVPIMKNLIIMNNDVGVRSYTRKDDPSVNVSYSMVGNSGSYNFWNDPQKGPNTIEDVAPKFYSADPNNPWFLYLSADTPNSILYGADDGGYMGALPMVPEPATLTILGLGGMALVLRRKK